MPIWSPGRHIPTRKIPKCPPPTLRGSLWPRVGSLVLRKLMSDYAIKVQHLDIDFSSPESPDDIAVPCKEPAALVELELWSMLSRWTPEVTYYTKTSLIRYNDASLRLNTSSTGPEWSQLHFLKVKECDDSWQLISNVQWNQLFSMLREFQCAIFGCFCNPRCFAIDVLVPCGILLNNCSVFT